VARALVRAVSRLVSTRFLPAAPHVGGNAGAAPTSACATLEFNKTPEGLESS